MARQGIARILLIAGIGMLTTGASGAAGRSAPAAGTATSPPIGWVQFCAEARDACRSNDRRVEAITLDEKTWRQVVRINAEVNHEIVAMSDLDQWSMPEHWSFPETGKGDCEDYVLEKRRRLEQAGFPISALLITVVRDRKGDGHAVLAVRTDRGDFILDNQASKVLSWQDTGYKFIKRQSETDPMRWVSLGGIDTSTVAARP